MAETNASASPKSFKDDFSLFVLKTAIDELRTIQFTGHAQQISAIKQSIYLCITIATAICALLTCTPFWCGLDAPLSKAGDGCVILFGLGFLFCVVGFAFGIYALRGEKGGIVQVEAESYSEILAQSDSDDDARLSADRWAYSLQIAVELASMKAHKKGMKVRALNVIVLIAGLFTAAAIMTSFLLTFFTSSVQL